MKLRVLIRQRPYCYFAQTKRLIFVVVVTLYEIEKMAENCDFFSKKPCNY